MFNVGTLVLHTITGKLGVVMDVSNNSVQVFWNVMNTSWVSKENLRF